MQTSHKKQVFDRQIQQRIDNYFKTSKLKQTGISRPKCATRQSLHCNKQMNTLLLPNTTT